MARKRFITSDMSIDERIADIAGEDPQSALMWPWFITAFDDWGRLDVSSPTRIKLEVFPAFPFTAADIEKAIKAYANVGIAYLYTHHKKSYLAIEPCKYYRYQTYIREKKRTIDDSAILAPINPPWENCGKCRALARTCAEDSALDVKCIPSPSPSPSPSYKEKEEEKPTPQIDLNFKKVIATFEKNIHPPSSFEAEQLEDWLKDIETDVLILAIREAVYNNARSMQYINSILNDWLSKGLRDKDAVEAYLRDRQDQKNKNKEAKNNGPPGNSTGANTKKFKIDKSKFLAPGTADI